MNLADFAWSERYFTQQTTSLGPAIFIHFPTFGRQTEDIKTVIKKGRSSHRWEPFASTVHEARRNEAPPTFNSLKLASTVTKGLSLKETKNVQKYCQKASFERPLHSNSSKFLSLQVGYVRAREGAALLGQENNEPRAFKMACHWVADFWVVHWCELEK